MAATLKVLDVDPGNTLIWVRILVTLTGNYAIGGDTLDFTTLAGQIGAFGQAVNSTQTPQQAFAYSASGQIVVAYVVVTASAPNTPLALNACKLKLITALGTELGPGAYSAGVLADAIEIQCAFRKLV